MYDIILGRDEADKESFGEDGLIFIGRLYVTMGNTTSLSNNVYLDVARSHVILICGKRGSGKCLDGDTLITLGDGSVRPIKELEKDGNAVISLNNKLKAVSAQKVEFFKRNTDRMVGLKLRSGREIKLTPEHPLLTIKGWVPVQDLRLGNRIATPRRIPIFGVNELEDYKIKLLAYFLAEGHTKKSWVLFSNKDEKIFEEFRECIHDFDVSLVISVHGNSNSGCYRVANKDNRHSPRRKKNAIKQWLVAIGAYGRLAKEKDIPAIVFKLKRERLALFLNRLFSCDGSIYYKKSSGWEVSYGSSSKKLAYGVYHLLLRFGILSKIRKRLVKYKSKVFTSYDLSLNLENCLTFIKEIGFFGKKYEKITPLLNDAQDITFNPNVDTIPRELWELYKPENWAKIGRFVDYKHPKAMRERIHYAPSRQTLLQIAEADENPALTLLAESDIFWDEIIGMSVLEGEFTVYDIAVPEYHNFVANDIFVHNSYSLSVIAEEIANLPEKVKENIAVVIFDTMGIFWSMKYPNERQKELLERWRLKPAGLNVKVFTPYGKFQSYKDAGIATDYGFSIKPSELSAGDWCGLFEVKLTEDIGVLIERVLGGIKGDYDIGDIIKDVEKDKRADSLTKDAVVNRFEAVKSWGLFAKEGLRIREVVKEGQVAILDISCYEDWSVKCLVLGLVCKKLLQERMEVRKKEELKMIESGMHYFSDDEKGMPLVWLMLDEGHQFLPRKGKTLASDALIKVLREGRGPGISMVIATQEPGEINRAALTQADIVISHRVTAKMDVEALNSIMHTYLTSDILSNLNNLPSHKGSAIVLDDNSERIYAFRTRPKMSWHGGDTPSSVKKKRRLLEV